MSNTVPDFLAAAIQKSSEDLIKTLMALPEDKRTWSPLDKGRTAMDQVAECVLTNQISALLFGAMEQAWNPTTRQVEQTAALAAAFDAIPNEMDEWSRRKGALGSTAEAVAGALRDSAAKAAQSVSRVPSDSLDAAIQMPWGPMTVAQVILYPLWNMNYHEGQITYISTLLD